MGSDEREFQRVPSTGLQAKCWTGTGHYSLNIWLSPLFKFELRGEILTSDGVNNDLAWDPVLHEDTVESTLIGGRRLRDTRRLNYREVIPGEGHREGLFFK